MPEIGLPRSASVYISGTQLLTLKLKAMRAGVWFKVLPRIDRVLVDLTIKVVRNVRSITLANNIHAIVTKLEGFLETSLSRASRRVGLQLAQKISLIAQKWGNTSAKNWSSDLSFRLFLTVMHTNEPKAFRTQSTIIVNGGT